MTQVARGKKRTRGLAARKRTPEKAKPPRCMICGHAGLVPGLDLGHQPIGDLILSEADLNEPETFYPMQLHHCTECGLAQLGYTVDPAIVYKDFPFVSGTTKTATKHLQGIAKRLVKRLDLTERDFAVDIGSNDGTLLKGYLKSGVTFLGIDPSGEPVRLANEAGIRTWHAFFNEQTAEKAKDEFERAKAITACGCFAHIADLDGVMRGVKLLLAEGGIFTTENQYWLDMVERKHYDNVFHQHLRQYSLRPLQRLMQQYDMEVFDVERSEVYGGSITVHACHAGDHAPTARLRKLLAEEERAGLYEPKTWARFARTIERKRDKLFDTIHRLVRDKKKVIGIGAPAKASTVMNYCGLGREYVDYVTEINDLRVGWYMPGVHVPIVHEDRMFDDPEPADAGLLFAWNYRAEIEPKLRARGWKGRIVLP